MRSVNRQGYSIFELLISITVLAIVLSIFVGSIANLALVEIRARNRAMAAQYARESLEIAYNLSLQDWSAFVALDHDQGFVIQAKDSPSLGPDDPFPFYQVNPIEFDSDIEEINQIFFRQISIGPAKRDNQGNVTELATGQEDQLTRRVSAKVYWYEGDRLEEVVFTTYITHLVGVTQ